MAATPTPEQQHPLWYKDRAVVSQLLNGDPTDYALAECARLRIRYQGFPGAYDLQRDLDQVLQRWQLSEEELFERTRAIHQHGRIYRSNDADQEDWS
jgi:hypothetical protein